MAGGHHEPVDVFRKSIIVLVLVAAMVVLYRFAVPGTRIDPSGLLALGFVILASFTFGELVSVIRLPHITGYLLAGVLVGEGFATTILPESLQVPPFDHGIMNHNVLVQLAPFETLALALIAMTAGGELKWADLKKDRHRCADLPGNIPRELHAREDPKD